MIADEYGSTFPAVHSFIEMVRGVIRSADSASDAVQRIRPRFAHQLADPGWLPPEYQEPAPRVGWGVAPVNGCFTAPATAHSRYSASSFLLTRRHRRTTTLHGPWSAFTEARRMRRFSPTKAGVLRLSRRRTERPGDIYALIPPRDDIHRVRTTSAETSVSIHLLINDTGWVWRHAYDPTSGEQRPFRSGYVNALCGSDAREAMASS
jgi:3-mercaptopropionate dioxygenase